MFYALLLDPWKSLSDVEAIIEKQHKSPVITEAKSLYDAQERSESSTRNLTERRTAIEVTAIRQRLEHGFICAGWVKYDRQMADGLTKPQAAWKLLEIMSARKWKVVWDATFQSARKLKVAGGSESKKVLMGRVAGRHCCSSLLFGEEGADRRVTNSGLYSAVSLCLLTKFYSRCMMMIADDSSSGVMYRDTIFTIIVYPEMCRDTIFMIKIFPDMYHDTVSISVSSRLSCVLCFFGCTRASLVLFGLSNTRVSPVAFSQDSLSKVFNVETSHLEGIPCHEWYSVLLGSTQLSLLLLIRLETWNSRGMHMDLSRGVKMNEFADLTTSEFVSKFAEEKTNIVWSCRKHSETHEYINEPLDQAEGPSLFFLLCVDLDQS